MTPAEYHARILAAKFADNQRPREQVIADVAEYVATIEQLAIERAHVERQSLHDDATVTP